MFGWLTRGDGARRERAKRRLGSPRASVFSEFALVMPLVIMLCSAVVEVIGYWDAQVMANHTAWQVGRIAAVRGSDGMEFSSKAGKWSKTGIESKSMPEGLKKALKPINDFIADANKFNNRGNVTAMFLMSTCGIGYYGGTPGETVTSLFTELVDSGLKAVTDELPKWLSESIVKSITDAIKIPGLGGDSGIGKYIADGIAKLLDKVVGAVLKPILEKLAEWMKEGLESLIGKDGWKIDELFGKGTTAARRARQLYGAASRIARAKKLAGADAVVVEELAGKGNFVFSKNAPSQGRLAYPQIADKESKSDGAFVTGAHGWPPNNDAQA